MVKNICFWKYFDRLGTLCWSINKKLKAKEDLKLSELDGEGKGKFGRDLDNEIISVEIIGV